MDTNTYSLDLPPLLQTEFLRNFEHYLTHISPADHALLDHPAIRQSLPKVWACSPFVTKYCLKYPDQLLDLIRNGDLLQPPDHFLSRLQSQLTEDLEETAILKTLRLFRHREMLRIAWRDLATWATLTETFQSLSNLADAMVEATLGLVYRRLIQQFGTPCNARGQPQHLVVLALGKLGGQELNFSSDIDLIFAYPEEGETQGPGLKRSRTTQEFFLRLGQHLINYLNQLTPEGLVFRVDMRLRPFGDSGPLVTHFAALESYYESHGRDWERYALVKARVIAGDLVAGQLLLNNLRPFVYRRYLDFNAFEALRNMKALIDQETNRKGLNNNLKLGIGGIREIEFTCQVFQLIRGGRQPALQQRHLLDTLQQLDHYQLLSAEAAEQLRQAYYFLRQAENHLQAIEDRQTQTLPDDPINQMRLAYSLGLTEWNAFIAQLLYHQQVVHNQFQQIISPTAPTSEHSQEQLTVWQTLWLHDLQKDEIAETLLKNVNFQFPLEILAHLRQLINSHRINKLSKRGRERLDILIPLLLAALVEYQDQQKDQASHRILNLIEVIAQRGVYLSLLIEHPQIIKQLIEFCAKSAWIAEQITRYPLLLDELLDPRRLYDPLKPEELEAALQAQLAHLPVDDLEVHMDSLNQFKRAHVLRIAAAEISGNLSVEVTSDYLSAVADCLVNRALSLAWDHLVQKHGHPYCLDQGELRPAGFCIVGYGKAGGIELSYGSDLDIIFLHDSQGEQQLTDGNKPLENNVFFMRLAQRIIHILTTNTPAGVLYELDFRLRPGGASGLLVSSLMTFSTYQRESAWTWEHQALVRARTIAGNLRCRDEFEQIRRDILRLPRQPTAVKEHVLEMRSKMRENLDKSTSDLFDVKQGMGGITDIEFMIQYLVLCWAHAYPKLLETTGMLPLLKLFVQHKLLDADSCQQLGDCYRLYRAETHRLALQNQPAYVHNGVFVQQRELVKRHWRSLMEG